MDAEAAEAATAPLLVPHAAAAIPSQPMAVGPERQSFRATQTIVSGSYSRWGSGERVGWRDGGACVVWQGGDRVEG